MVRVLDRKLLRELWHQKGLIIAITTLVAVGVMCFVYMRSAHRNLKTAQAKYNAQCRMADFWINLKKAPIAELQELAELRGIAELRPRIQFLCTVDLPDAKEPINGLVLSMPDRRTPVINDVLLKRGDYFTEQRRDEVLVNNAFAKKHHIKPGDVIHLILNNRRQELYVVGTAISSEFTYLVGPGAISPDPEHFGVFYLKQTFAEEVFDFDGAANQLVGRLAPELREHPDAILREAEAKLKTFGVFSVTPLKDQQSHRFLSDEIRGIGTFAGMMPIVFLAVAALVLNVLLLRLIDQQRVVIGTLKGLGYSNTELFLHFTKFSSVIGLCGGLVGWIMGYQMSAWVTQIYQTMFEFPELNNDIYPELYLIGMAISLTCSIAGSFRGARAALSLQPAEAMRSKPPAQGGRVWIERIPMLWSRLSSGWRMVLRNMIRHKARTLVGVFAASMGAAILSCGFILQVSMAYLIDFQFSKIDRSDVDLTFKDERGVDALFDARRLPAVDHAEPILDVACEFLNGPYRRKGVIRGLIPNARLTTPRDVNEHRIEIPKSGVTIARKLAELMHLRPGDMLEFEPIKGIRKHCRVPIIQLADSYMGLTVYADIDYLRGLIDEEQAVSGVQLEVDDRPEAMRELTRTVKRLPAVQTYVSRKAMIHNLNSTLVEMQNVFIGIMVVFAGVIFFASLLNMSLIGLAERRREVATFLVQGYTEWQVGGFFFRETMVTAIIGTLLGFPLGYLLVFWLTKNYDTEMFRFPLLTPPWVWVKTFLWGLGFAMSAHVFVHREICYMDWRDALSVKE
jgi:putative ABC transport system permease protein